MEKTTLSEIKSDIKYKRDSLHLAHEELKRQGDFWNKIIIFVSLGSSLFESTKMKMGWDAPSLELFPIILSSTIQRATRGAHPIVHRSHEYACQGAEQHRSGRRVTSRVSRCSRALGDKPLPGRAKALLEGIAEESR